MKNFLQVKGKQKILVVASIYVVSIFLADRIFLYGLRSKLRGVRQQIKAEEARLKKNLSIKNNKDKILSDYNNYQPYLKEWLVDEKQTTAQLLREIERLAKSSGVSIVNLNPQEGPEQAKGYNKYKADLRLEASPEQLISFLFGVSESKLLIKIDKLSLVPKDEQASVLRIEALISMAVL